MVAVAFVGWAHYFRFEALALLSVGSLELGHIAPEVSERVAVAYSA